MANGCVFHKPYSSLGSGSYHAIAIMEAGYKDDMTEEEAKELVSKSVEAGITHDLGSGSNIDLCIIRKGKVEYLRNHKIVGELQQEKAINYSFPKENTPFIKRFDVKFEKIDISNKMEVEWYHIIASLIN